MMFVSTKFDIKLELVENRVSVLVVEHQRIFADIISGIYSLMRNNSDEISLVENDKILNFSKTADIIVDPFSISCNEKRVTQKLYQEITYRINECMAEESAFIHGEIINYLEKAILTVPYDVTFEIELDILSLLKAYNVKICDDSENVVERIINYLKVIHRLCNIRVVVFVNLKTYLPADDIASLYEFAFYEKIHLILLENIQKNKIDGEKIFILDKDRCIIEMD